MKGCSNFFFLQKLTFLFIDPILVRMVNKAPITDIFFDLDHTLWDFEKNSALTFEKIFRELQLPVDLDLFLKHYTPINHAQWKRYRNNEISQETLRHERLALTFKELDKQFAPAFLERISNLYIDYLSTFPHLFEDALPLLDTLKQKYSLHIITNGFEAIQHRKIERSGLSPYFNQVFTADTVGQKKPHPLIFETALQNTQTQAQNALMVGDSFEADIDTPLKMGFQAIHFNSHQEAKHNRCWQVNALREIVKFFE